MFTKSKTESKLDAEINVLLAKLSEMEDKSSDEYSAMLERVSKLHKLKTEESPRPRPISPDTILVVAANIAGILWLARYEKEHVIKAPKAFGLVMKPQR